MKIKCIAVDDEPLALEKIKSYIEKIPYLDLLQTFSNGLDAITFLKEKSVELIFLDIQMDQLTGIQMLETMKKKPKVIFTTAYDEYAIKGYELDVSDYLLKPIPFDRFLQAVEKVADQLTVAQTEKPAPSTIENSAPESDYIFIKTEYRMQKVNLSDILYIEGQKDYLLVKCKDFRIMTLQNFKNMEERLPAGRFIRVHKSYIIAMDKIESIERNRIKIGDKLIPVGETYKKEFYKIIEKKGTGL